MPRRSPLSPSKAPFFPSNDQATYRDLLLFEERLKTNAFQLNKRKSRYQIFMFQLIAVIIFLLCEVTLQTSFLSVPYRVLLRHTLPELYGPETDVRLHPYVAFGLLLVSVTTLVLFFASGMYSEKIGYANRYVTHANRSLRTFNMYLNTRKAPRSFPLNPLSYLFPRPTPPSHSATPSPRRSPSPTKLGKRSSSTVPIPPIPPATNPRGELIFSSRVDRSFRESYERYRSTFERKRDERERIVAGRTWTGWIWLKMPWNRPPAPAVEASTPTRPGSGLRGRGAPPGGSPNPSRRTTPVSGSSSSSSGAGTDRGRRATPPERGAGYM
ncbi:hypothetical protein DENSPDRAFT_148486 [Dentipellis sp. KUC8613]|nr:hypothetical protein DENSPDRAFT_148486 [Dentipellis sp. KUC8613]